MGIRGQQAWFELLVELLSSGFSLKEAIEFSGTLLPQFSQPISKVNQRLKEGQSFANAMRSLIPIDTYYQLLLAEQHGQLLVTLTHFRDFLRLRIEQTGKLKRLLQYPVLLLALLVVMIIMMASYVFPQIQQLEQPTENDFFNDGLEILMVAVGSSLAWIGFYMIRFYRLSKIARVRKLCQLPVVGRIFRHYYGYYICSNLSLLISEGLSMQKIITICNQFNHESLLYQISHEVQTVLIQGKEVDTLIYREPFIPNELSVLCHQGSTSDKLGRQLNSLANSLFNRVVHGCENRLTFVQPLMYLIIAGVIIALYLKMLLPIYQTVEVMK